MSILEIFFITLGFTIIMIYWVWIYAIRIKNFSIIDAAWSGGFFVQAFLYNSLSPSGSSRKILLLSMIALWSLRLSYFLTKRIAGHHPQEDTRYAQLRAEYGNDYEKRFLYFYMMQAVSISVLTFPFIFVFNNVNPNLSWIEYTGVAAFAISLFGEALADFQMQQFKKNPKNKGRVCDVGLWRYSRHPNYFFESCIWFSFFIFILIYNWLGLLPGVGTIGRVILENGEQIFVPFLRGGAADLPLRLPPAYPDILILCASWHNRPAARGRRCRRR